jgi:hypothetical protein
MLRETAARGYVYVVYFGRVDQNLPPAKPADEVLRGCRMDRRLECPLIERTPSFESFESVALYQECHS